MLHHQRLQVEVEEVVVRPLCQSLAWAEEAGVEVVEEAWSWNRVEQVK